MAPGRKTGGRIKGVSKNKPKRQVLPPDTAKGLLDEAARALTLVSSPVRTPKAVMLDAMFRFENLGIGLLAKAEKLMKTRADPLKAAEIAQEGHKFIVAAVECATKAAPYIHARLLAIESRGDMTQDEAPFVIRVPSVVQESPAWQAAVLAERAEIEASRPIIPPRPEVSAPVPAFAPPQAPSPPTTSHVVLGADQDTSRIRAMPVGPVTVKPAGQEWLDSVMAEQQRKAG